MIAAPILRLLNFVVGVILAVAVVGMYFYSGIRVLTDEILKPLAHEARQIETTEFLAAILICGFFFGVPVIVAALWSESK